MDVRNFGDTTLREVRDKLTELGLRLGMRVRRPASGSCIWYRDRDQDKVFARRE